MTVSLETPSGIERTLSGSQAAKALLKRAERRKIDFIFCCNVVMKTATIENYETKRCMKKNEPQKRNPHYIVYTTAMQISKFFFKKFSMVSRRISKRKDLGWRTDILLLT